MSQATGSGPRTAARRGSFLSDKQVTDASRRGRQVTFKILKSQPGHEVTGYVVGKDDYHWMVACPRLVAEAGEDTVTIQLVHKSADLIVLDPKETLSDLIPEIRDAIKKIGEPFWAAQDRNQEITS